MADEELNISLLIDSARSGDLAARDELFAAINDRLRMLARGLMKSERPGHSLQASALVNEACLRLLKQGSLESAENRRYLFGAANRAMRQVLVDHARARNTDRRGGGRERHQLDFVVENFESNHNSTISELDEALVRLDAESPRQREVVEMKFFSGLTIQEIAELLDVSHGTVETDWRLARAKLYRWLGDT